MDLKDRVAIVTGAGSGGQGRALARHLAHEGAKVVVSDIDRAGGDKTVSLIESAGGEAIFVPANVEQEAGIVALIAETEKRFGGLGRP